MKINNSICWLISGMITLILMFSSSFYLLYYQVVTGFYVNLGFPISIINSLAIMKILGLLVICTRKNNILKEWAWAGFFFDALLTFFAHYMFIDGNWMPSMIALIITVFSRIYEDRAFSKALMFTINKESEI